LKKVILAVLAVFLFTGVAWAYNVEPGPRVFVNGKEVASDVQPLIVDGRTMVPIRAVAEALNTSINWDEDNNAIYITTQTSQATSYNPAIPGSDWYKANMGNVMPDWLNTGVPDWPGQYDNPSQTTQPTQTTTTNSGLELTGMPQVINTGAGWFLVGYVKNNSNYTYSFVNVGINLMDNNDVVVSKIYAKIKNLQPGDIGKFVSNPILDNNTTKYQITDISGR